MTECQHSRTRLVVKKAGNLDQCLDCGSRKLRGTLHLSSETVEREDGKAMKKVRTYRRKPTGSLDA